MSELTKSFKDSLTKDQLQEIKDLEANKNNIDPFQEAIANTTIESFGKITIPRDTLLDKLIQSRYNINEKADLIRQNMLEKHLDLSGYKSGKLVFPSYVDGQYNGHDADSGIIVDDETGQAFRYRAKAFNYYDAADMMGSVLSSKNKMKVQPSVVAELNEKRIEDLTAEDFKNVDTYNFLEMLRSLRDPDYTPIPYDKNIKYQDPVNLEQREIPILYKNIGTGFYGRDLTDIVNPKNGRSITHMAAMNPYTNMSFDLEKSLDTPENRDRYEEYLNQPATKFQAVDRKSVV